MKSVLLFLSLLFSSWAFAEAEVDPRLAPLEAAYNLMQQEQQSIYQQFLMTQELRRNELQELSPGIPRAYVATGMSSPGQLDYDENTRLQRDRQDRLQRYERDISQAYARYVELGAQKKVLLDQILELSKPAQ